MTRITRLAVYDETGTERGVIDRREKNGAPFWVATCDFCDEGPRPTGWPAVATLSLLNHLQTVHGVAT
jgi:hypothetical protein